MINAPSLFDNPAPAETKTPEQLTREQYTATMRQAAEEYRQARPELTRPRVFMGPQETSRKAAERALPRTGTQRHRIWSLMRENAGLTADEVNEATGISPNTINPTIRGLVLDNWLEDSGQRRVTRSGNEAIVWVPVL
jgi:predicted HTH transcriptional regulator